MHATRFGPPPSQHAQASGSSGLHEAQLREAQRDLWHAEPRAADRKHAVLAVCDALTTPTDGVPRTAQLELCATWAAAARAGLEQLAAHPAPQVHLPAALALQLQLARDPPRKTSVTSTV